MRAARAYAADFIGALRGGIGERFIAPSPASIAISNH